MPAVLTHCLGFNLASLEAAWYLASYAPVQLMMHVVATIRLVPGFPSLPADV